jgi:hypothetical protein
MRLRFSDDRQKPAATERTIPRWLHLVTELGFRGHDFCLCSQYSATGRIEIARDNCKKIMCAGYRHIFSFAWETGVDFRNYPGEELFRMSTRIIFS